MLKMLLSECYASAHRKCFLPWDLSVTSPIFFVEDFIKYVAYLVCKILIFLLGMPPAEPTFLFLHDDFSGGGQSLFGNFNSHKS